MRLPCLIHGLLAASALLVPCATACSSSSGAPPATTKTSKDAGHHDAVAGHDAAHDSAATTVPDSGTGPDAFTAGDARFDAGEDAKKPDARAGGERDAAKKDALGHSPFDAFTYPEAAIPHDAGHDAPVSRCSALPDESSYCAAPDGGGGSSGFYVCMQGNGIYSPCAPGTTCVATDSGAMGIACVR
jgi:hypothetical protein